MTRIDSRRSLHHALRRGTAVVIRVGASLSLVRVSKHATTAGSLARRRWMRRCAAA